MSTYRRTVQTFSRVAWMLLLFWACSPLPAEGDPLLPIASVTPATPVQAVVPTMQPTVTIAPPEEMLLQPTPTGTIVGSTVESGPFLFYVFLYRDASLGKQPVAPSLYSDMEGFGAYMFWKQQGSDLLGPVQEFWGTQPQLNLLNTYPELKMGQTGGRSGGILLPGGFFVPGNSKAGDRVHVVLKLSTPDKEYGALLTFELSPGQNGWEPINISVDTL